MEHADHTERRLAAILSADVHGYSRRMAADEAATVSDVKRCREIIGAHVNEHHGHVVDAPGDNVLAEFPSAVEAVQCAVEVQRELAGRNSALDTARRMEFRIGIHVGDVISDGVQIYGDGVNIAARLEGLAQPGGICISRQVHDQIRGKLDIDCEDIGEQQVKNIPRPVRVLRVRMGPTPAAPATRPPSRRRVIIGSIATLGVLVASAGAYFFIARNPRPTPMSLPAGQPGKATLAVLPFANMSANKDDEYFSDGMTDEIIGDLSKINGLRVAARTSSFAFKGQNLDARKIADLLHVRNLLEGSVRRAGNKVRIEVQLTDALSGFNLWSEKYDEDLSDVFLIQSEVAEQVAGTLEVKLLAGERARVEKKPTENLEAYNLYLLGKYYTEQFSEEAAGKAISYLKQAIAKDPNFALPHSALATALLQTTDWSIPPRESMPIIKAEAERALALDDTLTGPHQALAFVLLQYEWNWPAAESEFKRSLELAPNDSGAHTAYGFALSYMGRYEESLRQLERARELDPPSPLTSEFMGDMYAMWHKYDRARECYQQVIEMAPGLWYGYWGRGMLSSYQGDLPAAITDLEKAAALTDNPMVEGMLGSRYGFAGRRMDALKILDELKKASQRRYVPETTFAGLYFGLGDKDQAFRRLDQAYEDRETYLSQLRVPAWDPLRADPRFKAIEKKVGLYYVR